MPQEESQRKRKQLNAEEYEQAMNASYEPWTEHYLLRAGEEKAKKYIAGADGRLHELNVQSKGYDKVVSNHGTYENGNNRKIDIVTTESGKHYLREYRKKGDQYPISGVTHQEVPSAKVEINTGNANTIKQWIDNHVLDGD